MNSNNCTLDAAMRTLLHMGMERYRSDLTMVRTAYARAALDSRRDSTPANRSGSAEWFSPTG